MGCEPRGLATKTGSMPFWEAAEPLFLLKEYLPVFPNWSQSPLQGREEHFVNQFLKTPAKTGLLTEDRNKVFFHRIHRYAAGLSRKLRGKGVAAS
ncbi:MAG TPA: hypothetical protein PL078_01540 [Bacillota bacterium]|nr:hypothetical protein [Peptococcaceae bacterium MAG4]NLW37889.1 hypothetical protein [Peptococcaceae bacterium]HPZ42662.1 hypothetical protein [Bacillota bacterium]HQD75694.1 hypothetical protein [Bacillota bacterium]HUM57964.1 hypothetical protein [Bacillota bacterium]